MRKKKKKKEKRNERIVTFAFTRYPRHSSKFVSFKAILFHGKGAAFINIKRNEIAGDLLLQEDFHAAHGCSEMIAHEDLQNIKQLRL